MMVFKRKQIIILSLVLLILIAGYLQYNYNKSSTTASGNSTIGEAVYVDGDNANASKTSSGKDVKASTETASKYTQDYFTQTKSNRDITRSKDIESMKNITADAQASKESKAKAHDKMMALTDANEKEMRIESLVKERGFSDAIALIGDDGSVDIIVKTQSLNAAQTAQITDAISRQANVEISKVHIKPMF